MKWYLHGWRKSSDYSSRANRKEYWMFQITEIALIVGLAVVSALVLPALFRGHEGLEEGLALGLVLPLAIYSIAAIFPRLALSVRRLHDLNMSGLWILVGLVPFIGPLVLFVFSIMPGTPGRNSYGPQPGPTPGSFLQASGDGRAGYSQQGHLAGAHRQSGSDYPAPYDAYRG